jgi:hypothetical protein
MSTHKDDIQLRKAALLKAARSAIRLKHSLAADAELNEALPMLEAAFDTAVQRGTLPNVATLLRQSGALHDAE